MSCPKLHWRHDDLDITLLDQRTVDNPYIVVLAHAGTIEAALDGWTPPVAGSYSPCSNLVRRSSSPYRPCSAVPAYEWPSPGNGRRYQPSAHPRHPDVEHAAADGQRLQKPIHCNVARLPLVHRIGVDRGEGSHRLGFHGGGLLYRVQRPVERQQGQFARCGLQLPVRPGQAGAWKLQRLVRVDLRASELIAAVDVVGRP